MNRPGSLKEILVLALVIGEKNDIYSKKKVCSQNPNSGVDRTQNSRVLGPLIEIPRDLT